MANATTRSGDSALIRKLQVCIDLSEPEKAALRHLERDVIQFRRQADVIRDGDRLADVFIVKSGWAFRHKTESNGGRQIVSLVLPGDFMCLNAAVFERAYYTITAITPLAAGRCSPEEIFAIVQEYPRLALAIAWCNAREQCILREHLVSVGRRTSYERIAHLLIETWRRLHVIGLATHEGFEMPLSQEIIADAVGLSSVHVNRTLSQLRREGLIEGATPYARVIVIKDVDRLQHAAGFEEGYLHFTERPRWTSLAVGGHSPGNQDAM